VLDERVCGCCTGTDFRHKWKKLGYRSGTCAACGLVQVPDCAKDEVMRNLYAQDYFEGTVYERYPRAPVEVIEPFSRQLDPVLAENAIQGVNTCLELGCAHGFCLSAARGRGWTVRGVEISSHAPQWGRERIGLDQR